MQEVQMSEAKARFTHYLNAVERGETVIITRRGKAVARLVPEIDSRRESVQRALDDIAELRKEVKPWPLKEILAARHEGHKY